MLDKILSVEVASVNAETSPRDPYLVKSVIHSAQLLSAFQVSGEALPLREITKRSSLPKTMAFRLLYTLERCGMVEKIGENLYRSTLRAFKQKLYRIGLRGRRYGSGDSGVGLLLLDNPFPGR